MSDKWKNVPLSQIAEINPRLGKVAFADDETFNFVPMAAVGACTGIIDITAKRPYREVKKGFTTFQPGDVVFAKITPCMENGKIAVVPLLENCCGFGSTEFHVIRPKTGLDSKYLYYFLSCSGFRKEAARHMTGAVGQKRVPTDFLKRSVVPLPPTVDDQKRIVAEIEKQFSRLNEAVRALKRIQSHLKRFKTAALKDAVEGKLTEQWRQEHPNLQPANQLLKLILAERRIKWEAEELSKMTAKGLKPKNEAWKKRYKEAPAPDITKLPRLPCEWVWASPTQLDSGEAYATAIGPFGSNLKVSDYRTAGTPLVFVKNIRSKSFSGSDTKYIDEEKAKELRPHWVKAGDVLITKMGAPPGDATSYPEDSPTAVITADCIKTTLCPVLNKNRDFFVHAINSEVVKQQIAEITQGVAQQKISLARFASIGIPLPPLDEQSAITQQLDLRLSVIENFDITIKATLKRAERLRQTILLQAFSGQLV